MIEISRLEDSQRDEWVTFLRTSNDGTLFHDPRFLLYHPPDRFRFFHLAARRKGKLFAVVPGSLVTDESGTRFVSPAGASVGGPASGPKLPLAEAGELVEGLQRFAVESGWNAVEMTLAPSIYHRRPSQTLPFELARRGFQMHDQRLSSAIPLHLSTGDGRFERSFRATAANEVRAARRRGAEVTEGGLDLFDNFLALFTETYDRLGATPTHHPEELRDLVVRLPEYVRIFSATLNGETIAATLVFLLNDVVAYSFYPMMGTKHANENGNKVIFADIMDRLGGRGYRWLDLGPSASFHHTNANVAFFKEGLGAVGHARTAWRWDIRGEASSSGQP